LTGVAVTATDLLWTDGQRAKLILPLWVAFAGAQASVWIGKYAIGRARPVFLDGNAFPIRRRPGLPLSTSLRRQ